MLPVVADSTKLSDNQYYLAHNVRVRWGVVSPIKRAQQVTDYFLTITTKLQGVYAAGSCLIVFADGYAYSKDLYNNTDFTPIDAPGLDANVDIIYAQLVPESSFNFTRELTTADGKSNLKVLDPVTGNPSCLVCQDGINQPLIIYSDLIGRVTCTYDQWTSETPEYVPIGKMMAEAGGRLYIVSSDYKSIYRSVSGRPLDFMVNIQQDGSKELQKTDGDADSVSHAVGYSPITCIRSISAVDSRIFVSSANQSWVVIPDLDNQIFGEPTFINAIVGPSGAVNQFSFADVNGDATYIHQSGIRSFNAVAQDKNLGRNTPFSANISPLLRDIRQTNCAAAEYDDYILFAVKTTEGYGVLVYDMVLNQYVSLDQWYGISGIKQFCLVNSDGVYKLFFITTDHKLYEAFASTVNEEASIYIGDFSSGDEKVNLHPWVVDVAIHNVSIPGNVRIQPSVDAVDAVELSLAYTTNSPVTLDIGRASAGWRVGYWLKWTSDTDISRTRLIAETVSSITNVEQKANAYKTYMES